MNSNYAHHIYAFLLVLSSVCACGCAPEHAPAKDGHIHPTQPSSYTQHLVQENERYNAQWYAGASVLGLGGIELSTGGVVIDFRPETPAVQCRPQIGLSAAVGAGVWSDPRTGNLQLLSNGLEICDATGTLLENGTQLGGSLQSPENGLIVPVPGTALREFYVFSNTGTELLSSRINYSVGIVDLDVRATVVASNTGQTFGGLSHPSAGFWVVAPNVATMTLDAYLISSQGIPARATISSPLPSNINTLASNARGTVRFSKDGSRIALALETDSSNSEIWYTLGQSQPLTLTMIQSRSLSKETTLRSSRSTPEPAHSRFV